jgi:hypothetical protein
VAFAPSNVPPVAVHEVALAELQVNVAAPSLLTVVGDAVIDAMAIDAVAGAGLVTIGTDPDPPQAARSSAAPIVITGAVERIRVLWKGRIMSAAGLWLNPVRAEATTAGPQAHFMRRIKRHPFSRYSYISTGQRQVENAVVDTK